MEQFHFSPRPNRAHEINWLPWSGEAFDRADEEKKPVLLAISGVWCHWCHVMDEKAYSEQSIIDFINENYVAVRVDTDQRPDINERYNMGGWPTTAVLSSDGDLLTGATYIPPKQMLAFLQEMAELYRERREDLHQELAEKKGGRRLEIVPEQTLKEDIVTEMRGELLESYDSAFGGFGGEPKFPMTGALALGLYEHYDSGDTHLRDIVLHSLRAMAGGGMYDPVEGGFFRYSTTRDWSIPHFEKMLEDNANLLGVLADAYNLTGEVDLAETARDVIRFLENSLYLPETKAWAGTQDADEEYYSLPQKERNQREAPYIDKNVYVNWNALLARSLLKTGLALKEPRQVELGLATLAFLMEKCWQEGQGMAHVHREGPMTWGLLTDQAATGRAANMAFQVTGDRKWLAFSEKLAAFCRGTLQDEKGAFMDRPPEPGARGALARPHFSVEENARAARWLLELAALTHEQGYKDDAVRALLALGPVWRRYGLVAAGYALAVADAVRPWAVVTVSGPAGSRETGAMHRAALAGYRARRAVVLQHEEGAEPKAYVCFGEQCLQPVTKAGDLRQTLEEGKKYVAGVDVPGPAPGFHRP